MKKSISGLNDRQKSGRQTVYQRGSQRDGSPHYVLLYSDDECSGDEESIPLQKQSHSNSIPRKVEVIKIQVQPEDTLQALALKYGCTISEIKRINSIHKDNEIFAHRLIKVPVQPFSFLTESLNIIHNDGTNNIAHEIEKPSTSNEEPLLNLTTPIVIAPRNAEINNIILNSIIEPVVQQDDIEEDSSNESTLLSPQRQVNLQADVNSPFTCSGDNWGLTWRHVVGIFLLLGIIIPLYILYINDLEIHR